MVQADAFAAADTLFVGMYATEISSPRVRRAIKKENAISVLAFTFISPLLFSITFSVQDEVQTFRATEKNNMSRSRV
jgi:hypothetical protein